MIITCEKCWTQFNLDESLLNADGSTVRCSRCQHIFTAFPPPAKPEFNDLEFHDIDLDKDLEFDDSDFDEDEDLPETADDENLTKDVLQETVEPEKLELETIDPDEEGFDGLDEFDDPNFDVTDLDDAGSSDARSHDPPPPRRPARASLIHSLDQEDGLMDSEDTPAKKMAGLGRPVIVLLLLFLLAGGGYIAATFLGYRIPFLSEIQIPFIGKYLPEKTPETVSYPDPIPDQKSVTGRFITNDNAGELFIITGKIKNPAQIPYRRIQVKGTLFQKEKTAAMSQIAFCGNIIPEGTLKTGRIEDLTTQLKIPGGTADVNEKTMPGDTVPFMLVFADLPRNLENFTVEVAEFEKATP